MELMRPEAEKRLAEKLVKYYEKLFPGTQFSLESSVLSTAQLSELNFTYPGAENLASFEEKVVKIKKAISHGYSTPIIVLKKGSSFILVDGHRRVIAALQLGLNWPAIVVTPSEDHAFGIEKTIQGTAKDEVTHHK